MVNGLSAVYDELDNGQLATVEELVEALYPGWFDTKTYIEQYTILTNTLDKVTPNIEPDRWKKIKQSLRFNKSALLDSIRLMAEMGLLLKNIKIKKITEEQMYLVATYNAILRGEDAKIFALKKNFSESEIDNAVKTALVAKDKRRGKEVKSIESVDCNTVVIHGIHQFTPTILSMLEEVTKDEESIEISFTGQSERKKKLINYLIVEQKLNNDILLDFDVIKKIELISDYYGNATPKHVGIITAHIENMESYKELKKLKNEEDEKEVENIRNCYNSFLDEYFSDNNQRTILNKLLEGLKLTFINS